MKREIGSVLRELRNDMKLSVEQVSKELVAMGYKASVKTVYSWESGNSKPTPDVLLKLCHMYNVKDVLGVFGYLNDGADTLSINEEKLIKKYRELDEHGKDVVETIILKELSRVMAQQGTPPPAQDEKITEF